MIAVVVVTRNNDINVPPYYVHKFYDGCVEPYHLTILMMNEGEIFFMIEDNYFFPWYFLFNTMITNLRKKRGEIEKLF